MLMFVLLLALREEEAALSGTGKSFALDRRIDSRLISNTDGMLFLILSVNDDRLGNSRAAILTPSCGCFIPGWGWRRSWDILAGWSKHAATIVTFSFCACSISESVGSKREDDAHGRLQLLG